MANLITLRTGLAVLIDAMILYTLVVEALENRKKESSDASPIPDEQ